MDSHAYDFITLLMQDIQQLISNFIIGGYNAVMTSIEPALASALILLIVGIGVALWTDHIEMSRKAFFGLLFRIALVWTLATNWAFVSEYVLNALQQTANQLGMKIVTQVGFNIPGGSDTVGALQIVSDEFYNYGHTLIAQGGFYPSSWTPLIQGLLLWLAGILLVVFALFELILAQVSTAILIVITPFIALFLLTPWTKGVFERWAGMLVGYMFLIIFVYSVLALVCNIAYQMMPTHDFSNYNNVNAQGFLAPIIVIGFGIGILLNIQSLAMQIGGGVTSASGTSIAGATLGGFMGGMASGAVSGYKQLLNKSKQGGSSSDGQMKSAEKDVSNLRRGD